MRNLFQSKKNIVPVIIGIIALFTCSFLYLSNLRIKTAAADDAQSIKKVVVKAIECTHGSLTQLTEDTVVNDDLKNSMLKKIERPLKEIYSAKSPMLANRINSVRGVILSESNNSKDLGGGIRWIRNEKLSIDKDTATYEADVRVWSKIFEQGKVFCPEATCHYIFTLVNENGQWKITGESFNFLPGEEP